MNAIKRRLMPLRVARIQLAVIGSAGLIVFNSPALAAPIAYDGFNYESGLSLAGRSGGGSFGFSGDWALGGLGAPQHEIGGSSLADPTDTLAASGNHATVQNVSPAGFTTARRTLSQSMGTPGTRRYFSLLLQPLGTLGEGDAGGYFGLELVSTGMALFAGKPTANSYVIENIGGTGQAASTVSARIGQPALLVLRADFAAGTDAFRLYVNPDPRQPEPTLADALKSDSDVGQVTALGVFSSGAFNFDEIRVGETYADVTPVPEPAGWVVLLTAGVALARAPRRARSRRQEMCGAICMVRPLRESCATNAKSLSQTSLPVFQRGSSERERRALPFFR